MFKPSYNIAKSVKREVVNEQLYSKEGLGISEVCYKSKNYAFVENFFDNSSPSGQILVLFPLTLYVSHPRYICQL